MFSDVIHSVSMKILSASPRNTGRDDGPLSIYEYSYSDFSHVDPRIKLYLWDKFIPTVEDICAFVRVSESDET